MKINFLLILVVATLLCMSCDEGKLPKISFKQDAGYTYSDATVAKNTTIKIGINASKSEKKDPLKKFTVTRKYDSGSDETLEQQSLSGSQGDNFSYETEITTRNEAGTEKYTFTVVNRDGLINQVSLTLTVTP